jgi:hypothetical protein
MSSLLFLGSVSRAEDLYVRPGLSTGAHNGADWNNAWSSFSQILWGSGAGRVGPGDTLWLAGGNYSSGLTVGASGTAGSPITIKRVRASDAVPAAAAGWSAAFDSQVVITTSGSCIYLNGGLGSYLTIDGQVPSGIRVNYANGGRGVEMNGGTDFTDVLLRYIEAAGPGPITQVDDTRGFDLTTQANLTNLTVSRCEAHHSDTLIQVTRSVNLVIEHSDFHHAGAINAATYHPNTIYLGTVTNATIRYNKLREIDVEGLFFGDPGNDGARIYGNLFYQGSSARNSGRGIEFDNTANTRNFIICNNTFVDLPLAGVNFSNGQSHPGAVVQNNIFFNNTANFGPAAHDYNYFSGSNPGEPNGVGGGTAPFVNASAYDYRIVGTVAAGKPRNEGLNLGSAYEVDRDGNLRGADGAWDIGAYEYASGGGTVNTPPTISSIAGQSVLAGSQVGPLGFAVGDAETAAGSLTLSGASSNVTLVPVTGIAFGGSGSSRTVTVSPAANQLGTATITLTVSDGSATSSTSFDVTVTSGVNTAPTISAIASQNTTAGVPVGPVGFVVGDAETAAGSLTVSAASSNPTLVPSSNVTFGGSGSNRTVTVAPASGQTGSATITLSVSDGAASASSAFTLTVSPAAPAGAGLVAAYGMDENGGSTVADKSGFGNTGQISGATWTPAGKYGAGLAFNGSSSMVVVGASSSLAASAAITLEAWAYPTATQSGWRTLVQKEVDAYFLHAGSTGSLQPAGGGTFGGSVSFNNAPAALSLNAWSHVAMTYDGATLRLYVNGTQVASKPQTGAIETNGNALRIGGNVPYGEFFQGVIDEVRVYNRALSAAEIQGDMQTPINSVVVPPANTAPTISTIVNQTTTTGVAVGPIGFTVGDAETAADSLTLASATTNATVVPVSGITFGGSGASRTVTISPAAGQTGTATVTVTVSDGALTANGSFTVTVNPPPNTAPTISTIASQTITSGLSTNAIGFTVADAETAPGSLTVSGTSSDTALVPNTGILFGGSGANRTVTLTTSANQTGTAAITVTVSDGAASASTVFTVTLAAPANTPPTIGVIPDQTVDMGKTAGPIALTIGDNETAAGDLTLAGASSDTTLLPNTGIMFGGSGANRTITLTPAPDRSGTTVVTVTVSDGKATAKASFTLVVNAPAQSTGLVAAYGFNESAGTTTADASGNGNAGDLLGATWTAAGKFGGALNFNGSGNLVFVKSSTSLSLAKTMTLEAWAYPTATQSGWRTLVQKEADAYFLHAGSKQALRPAGGGTINGAVSFASSPTAIPVKAWTHLAVTYDGALIRLFINGVQVASKAQTGTIEANSNGLRIGGNVPYGEYFKGIIDEVRIYNRALTAAEIQTDMQTPIAASAPAPSTAWQHVDVGSVGLAGTDAVDTATATIQVTGSGVDIWGTADGFRYVYRPLRGDGVIEGRVNSITNTNAWAKAGVMIRESLAPGARNVFAFVTPGYGVRSQVRASTDGATTSTATTGTAAPYWVRLVRSGDVIVASRSADGIAWVSVATYTVPMGADVYAGFAVTSHDNTVLATGVFAEPFMQ